MISNFVVVPNAISDEDMNRLEILCSTKTLSSGLVDGGKEKGVRKSKILFLEPEDGLWVFNIIGSIAESANEVFKFDISRVDMLQYGEYDSEYGGHYGWHSDSQIGSKEKQLDRKLSISLQLSDTDEYEGGNLELRLASPVKKEIRERGTAIVFPSFLEHRVTKVTKGKRSSLVAWIEGEKFC